MPDRPLSPKAPKNIGDPKPPPATAATRDSLALNNDGPASNGDSLAGDGVLADADGEAGAGPDEGLEGLLDHLRRSRGFDFAAYKRGTLARRVRHRLQSVGLTDYAQYADYLEVHPGEFAQLFNTILISVTSFFRDPAAWEHLRAVTLPRLIASKPAGANSPLRFWVAGCASGEEPYTLAMVLAELLGAEGYAARVKIYATDWNEGDLSTARQAVYSARAVENIPEALRARYLRPMGSSYQLEPELRRNVVFGRHDLLSDSPIGRVDGILCRNVLMYFNTEAQDRVLQRMYFALQPRGFVFLGKAEMLVNNLDLFSPDDLRSRVFVKTPAPAPARLWATARAYGPRPAADEADASVPEGTGRPTPEGLAEALRIREAALRSSPVPQVVVDRHGVVVEANEQAAALLMLSGNDLGRPLAEVPFARSPVDLVGTADRAAATGQPMTLKNVDWPRPDGMSGVYDIQVVPLMDPSGSMLGVSFAFAEVTSAQRLRENLAATIQERETAHEELQTANEELQSTVQELETTNEELQSTNEELETINEELHSTNMELQGTNTLLGEQSEELESSRLFWAGVLACLPGAVVVLDEGLRVRAWSGQSTELWGLREDEVRGKLFLVLDIGLPVAGLGTALAAALRGESGALRKESEARSIVLPAHDRRGRRLGCRVTITPLKACPSPQKRGIGPEGVVLFMEEVDHGASPAEPGLAPSEPGPA